MDLSQLMDDAESLRLIPTDEDLKGIAALARKQMQLVKLVAEAEESLTLLKQELRNIQEGELPGLMSKFDLSSFVLSDGTKIEIKPDVRASIPADKRDDGYAWLKQHGHGDIIKTEVSVRFGKDSEDDVKKLRTILSNNGFSYEAGESVHASTLKAWVKERLRNGESLPTDIFSVFEFNSAKITVPKERKKD